MAVTQEELRTLIKSAIEEAMPEADSKESKEEQEKKLIQAIGENVTDKFTEVFNEKFEKMEKDNEEKAKKIKYEEEKKEEKPVWKSFGEQLQAVAQAMVPNGTRDPRLKWEKLGETKSISGANETIGAEGGFLVSPEYSSEILKVYHETGIVSKDCRHMAISGNRLIMNAVDETSRATGSRWGGIQVYWAAEGGTVTASKPKFRQVDVKLNKLMGLHYATDEVLADASALQSITTQGFGEEFAFMIDDAVINGTGAGQPLGVLNASALVSQAKEGGQDADTILAENISGMWNLMPAKNRRKAIWYAIQDVEPQLWKMYFSMGTGAVPVFIPPVNYGTGGLVGAPNDGSLVARPLKIIEQAQALGDKGDILFLDLSQYLVIEKTGGMRSDASIHVRFLYDENTFRFIYRIDGQPMWSSYITSYHGSVDRSPYVTLDERA